jgi:hypothetical protein
MFYQKNLFYSHKTFFGGLHKWYLLYQNSGKPLGKYQPRLNASNEYQLDSLVKGDTIILRKTANFRTSRAGKTTLIIIFE